MDPAETEPPPVDLRARAPPEADLRRDLHDGLNLGWAGIERSVGVDIGCIGNYDNENRNH
jgi:hypothetical protein